ncbi:MAG TPA: CDP-alcohol phosphatidyltransferase family protein [Thermoanaerobaculia bacterium]|nr:CDP-alcohol phosphatidyltransferase family protein [Thermoanaerobaculia bacterium]
MHPWRERLNRWFTPIATRSPLSPNAITILALLINVAAAILLALGARWPPNFLIAVACITVAGFADALDGIVARLQHKETRFGDFLDHVCDRISDTLLAACWMIGNRVREVMVVAVVIVVMLNGYIGTQIEASFRERNYEALGRGEFVLTLVVFPILSFILFVNGWAALVLGGATIAEWLSILLLAFALLGILQRIALARRMDRSS